MTDHLIRGRYQPLDSAGRGGQGEVIRMIDLVHDRQLALKVRRLTSEDERESLLQEARILLDMRPHPNLPLVREDFVEGDLYFIAMDWIEGRSLHQVLHEEGTPGLPLKQVLGYVEQAAEAVDHLHDHDPPILHLDVKPANLILTADGRVVLVDFGISIRWDGVGERPHGTPDYAAPEISTAVATPASDIYGLAATAYTLITGAPPRPEIKPHLPGVPEKEASRLLQAIRRGLKTNPRFRPASGAALVEAMRAACPTASPTRVSRRHKHRRFWVALAVVLTIVSVGTWLLAQRGAKWELAVLEVGRKPASVEMNTKTNRVYVAESESRRVLVIDGKTNENLTTVAMGSTPLVVGVNPKTNEVYVGESDRSLSVMHGVTHSLVATVGLQSTPVALAVNPGTNQVYVAGQDPDSLVVIDGATHSLVATVGLQSTPVALAVNPGTNQVYVAGQDPDSLVVIDGATHSLVARVPLGSRPCGIAVSPNLNRIYVATQSGTVDVFQGSTPGFAGLTASSLGQITVPQSSCAIALNPNGNRAYVAGGAPPAASVIDVISNQVIKSRRISNAHRSATYEIAVNPSTRRVYLLDRESHTLAVLNEKAL